MKILILFFLSFSLNGFTNYVPESQGNSPINIYLKLSKCEKIHGEKCHHIQRGHNPEINSLQDMSVNDFTKPIKTKSEMVTCSDPVDCQAKLAAKVCTDSEETAIKNLDLMEIYCSKDSFSQMIVKIIREDASKKAVYDAAKAVKAANKLDRDAKRAAAKGLKTKLKAGADLTSAELRQVLLAILADLKD